MGFTHIYGCLIAIIILNLLIYTALGTASYIYMGVDPVGLRVFLESQYVSEVGLLRASKYSYPDNVSIYIASDNLLGARALETLGSSLAASVLRSLEKYGGGWDGKHDPILLKVIGPPRPDRSFIIGYVNTSMGVFTILYDHVYDGFLRDWYNYSDWVILVSINNVIQGRLSKSIILYRYLLSMWDGYGFRDKVYKSTGLYDTYKIALAVYLQRALSYCGVEGLNWSIYEDWLSILSRSQRSDGGIITNYMTMNGAVAFIGDANTETTSIVALALYSDYPLRAARLCLNSYSGLHFVLQ